MAEHKHAEVLRAIADGVPLSEFEVNHEAWKEYDWQPMCDWANSVLSGNMTQVRRKPQYIMVNGFKVPKPLDAMPDPQTAVFSASTAGPLFAEASYGNSPFAKNAYKRGILHKTPPAAIAHAKAMLGIDPEYFKE